MPPLLAAADIGVAPFDVSAHAPLSLAFYWSPLKIFEYMASGLPVVAPDIDGIRRIVTDGREGVLYDPADAGRARARARATAGHRSCAAAGRRRARARGERVQLGRALPASARRRSRGALGSRRAGQAAS